MFLQARGIGTASILFLFVVVVISKPLYSQAATETEASLTVDEASQVIAPLEESSTTSVDDEIDATMLDESSQVSPTIPPDNYLNTYKEKNKNHQFYTYAGALVGIGYNSIHYQGWDTDSHASIDESGFYTTPQVSCLIDAELFLGQINFGYCLNFNDSELTTVNHMYVDSRIKYLYKTSLPIIFSGGLGLYTEFPPASQSYNGAGFLCALGFIYPFTTNWMLLCDIDIGYGIFGMGEESRKIHYGISTGVVTKVGNL